MSDVVWEPDPKLDKKLGLWYWDGRKNGKKIRKYYQPEESAQTSAPVQDETTPRDMGAMQGAMEGLSISQPPVGSYDGSANEYSYQSGLNTGGSAGQQTYYRGQEYGQGQGEDAASGYGQTTMVDPATAYPQVPDPALYQAGQEQTSTLESQQGSFAPNYHDYPGTSGAIPENIAQATVNPDPYADRETTSRQHRHKEHRDRTHTADHGRSKKDKPSKSSAGGKSAVSQPYSTSSQGYSASYGDDRPTQYEQPDLSRHKSHDDDEEHERSRKSRKGKELDTASDATPEEFPEQTYEYSTGAGSGQYPYQSEANPGTYQTDTYEYEQQQQQQQQQPQKGHGRRSHASEGSSSVGDDGERRVQWDLPQTAEDEDENDDDEYDDEFQAALAQSKGAYYYGQGLAESSHPADPAYASADEGTQTPTQHASSGSLGMTDIQGTAGEFERLDPRYKVEPSHRFGPGEVFKVLWYEPRGALPGGGSVVSEKKTLKDHYGEVFVGFRRFIVIANDEGHCACVPILTYDRQGCKKRGVKPRKHGIIYEDGGKPKQLRDEPTLGFKPIRVRISASNEKISRESRVNYSKIVTVEHNVKVFFIGSVVSEDLKIAKDAVDKCWGEKVHDKSHHTRRPRK
ncbi:hypothetical protein NKR23_g7032 [Pleurostoma richardsiae]|uniref:DUF6590 domain-containing protein n=1 Tax=Pleurostoma richardsiae TaxID=41990 RepID=A0AA38RX65_9PEZI|nr:hypothetical protein NKR23_g7032 [Pleurostoma richardsiae]